MSVDEDRVKAQRLDDVVAWLDYCLALPMFAAPTTIGLIEEKANLRRWRSLLVDGLHPDALAKVRAGMRVGSRS